MAYRYRILSGTILLGLLGLAAYSIANRGNYEEAHMLIERVPKLMSDEVEVPTEEDIPQTVDDVFSEPDEDTIIDSPKEEKKEEEVDVNPKEDPVEPTLVVVTEEKPVDEEQPKLDPKPSEEPKVEAQQPPEKPIVIEDKKVESKPNKGTSGSRNKNKTSKSKSNQNTKAKGKKTQKPGKGVDISKGPLTVSQNPENEGKYQTYQVGDTWKDDLLDTANPAWWVANEKYFISKYSDNQLKTKEFKDMLKKLKEKGESMLDGKSLMELCGNNYSHKYESNSSNDSYASDIWLSCKKLSDSSYPTTS